MASRSLRNRLGESTNIWPGFVDVLATLLNSYYLCVNDIYGITNLFK